MKKNFTSKLFGSLVFFALLFCVLLTHLNAQTIAKAYYKDPVVSINLMLPSGDSTLLVDGTAAMYNNKFSPTVDQYDAGKLNNFFENICLLRDGKNLSIEARPFPKQNDTLFINMWGLRKPAYNLQISINGIPSLLAPEAWLIDNYKHARIPINFFGKTLCSFLATADSNSYQNRFMVVFSDENQNIPSIHNGDIKVFPNPVIGNKLSLQFINMGKDNYNITLSSFSGETLIKTNIIHNGGNNTYYIPLNSVIVRGLNTITVYGSNARKTIHLPIILIN